MSSRRRSVSSETGPQDDTTAETAETSLLASAALDLLGCRTSDDVFRVAGAFLGRICPGTVVILNEISPDSEHFVTREIVGLDSASLAEAEDLVGFSIIGMRAPLAPRFRDAMLRGTLVRVPEGFAEFAAALVRPEIGATLEQRMGICDVYTMGFADGDSALGNVHILTRSPEYDVPVDIVESFGRHCFSVLERIRGAQMLESVARYGRELFERAPLGYQSLDEDGRFLDVNEAWLDTLGYERDAVIGRWFGDLLAPEYRDAFRERFPLFKERGRIHSEFEMLHHDGTRHFVAFEGRIGYKSDGAFARTHCILTDITEHRRADEALRASEERYRSIAQTTMDGLWIMDADGRLVEVNEAYCQMSGYSREELIGETVMKLDAEKSAAEIRAYTELIAAKGHARFETSHRRKDGSVFDVEVGASLRPEDGGLTVAIRDITERRLAEQAVRESEDKFKYLFEHSVIANSLTMPNGQMRVNQAFLDMLGYSREELAEGTTWQQVSHPGDVPAAEAIAADLLAGKLQVARFLKRFIHKDGHVVWGDVSTTLRRDADGSPQYFMTSINDVTESKRAREALEESRDMIMNLTATVPGVVYQYKLNPDGSSAFPFATGGMNDIYEVSPEEVREDATAVFGRLHPDDADRVGDLILESARTLAPFRCEYRVVLPRQGLRWRLSHAMPQRTEDGGTLWHGVIQDVTDRRLAEEELARYREHLEELVAERTRELEESNVALEAATKAKSDFLASMSHELRTPLNSIIGFGTLLEQGLGGPLNDEQLHHIGLVNASGKHLLSLVNDILDLSRIESGKTVARFERFEVKPLVSTVLHMVGPMADAKGIRMRSILDDETASVVSDVRLVSQILANLLSNAVKFTDQGSVTTRVFVDGDHTVFSVSDTGKGIPEEDLPHITERFYQVGSGISATIEGAGLGLAISVRLAEMLGATLNAESEPGVGSTFTLRVPTEHTPQDE